MKSSWIIVGGLAAAVLWLGPSINTTDQNVETERYIIQGQSADAAAKAVAAVNATLTHRLAIINAVGADLTPAQKQELVDAGLTLHEDRSVKAATSLRGVVGGSYLDIHNEWVSWDLTNVGDETIYINTIEASWPSEHKRLVRVWMDNKKIHRTNVVGTSAVIDGNWQGADNRRRLRAGETRTLYFEFKRVAPNADEGDYQIRVDYDAGFSSSWPNQDLGIAADFSQTHYPTLSGAAALHDRGYTGAGVTIAFLDTGLNSAGPALNYNADGDWRVLAAYNAIDDTEILDLEESGFSDDYYGHSTHLQSIALSAEGDAVTGYNGIAPGADLVSIKAFSNENGTYTDVIRGIEWAVENQERFNIRVLNLSFSAQANGPYWADAINQAVMEAWDAGIVVVASAGNAGPYENSIGVPGNNPYVITVGAMTDNFTPADPSDDFMADFSSAGPTGDGFVKPEIVAPGGHMLGRMGRHTMLGDKFSQFYNDNNYFEMSGTSQAAALVSGIVALSLERAPFMSPDDVKCNLLTSARTAIVGGDEAAYSIFQQGAGLVDALQAMTLGFTGCIDNSANLDADISGETHFIGPAYINENGEYAVNGVNGTEWAGADATIDNIGLIWTDGGSAAPTGVIWDVTNTTGSGVGSNGVIWDVTTGTEGPPSSTTINGVIWDVTTGTDGGTGTVNGVLSVNGQSMGEMSWLEALQYITGMVPTRATTLSLPNGATGINPWVDPE